MPGSEYEPASVRHIRRIKVCINDYRRGSLDIEGLGANLSGVEGALESDLPKSLREAVFNAVEEAETARFLETSDRLEISLAELEKEISNYEAG